VRAFSLFALRIRLSDSETPFIRLVN
jgi:hypothetical protein